MQKIIKVTDLKADLTDALSSLEYDKIFILADSNTHKLCYPRISDVNLLDEAKLITIEPGDQNKNLENLSRIWSFLAQNEATRHSLLINIGGGVITDIGGFAAATFKRGIKAINIPTTILGAVDAAVGGKTSINYEGLKNEIGSFFSARYVLIDVDFFKTLDDSNFMSGYAEMVKHGLISTETDLNDVLAFNLHDIDYDGLMNLVIKSVYIKEDVVKADPFEKDIRKALNLGHTIGHAFESKSYAINKPMLHGYAIAWGLVCELYLSYKKCYFQKEILQKVVAFVKENYGLFYLGCDEYEALYELMKHDKKNATSDKINFTLVNDIGSVVLNQTASKEDIFESIDFLRESLGL